MAFQYPVEIPGIGNTTFSLVANAIRKYRGQDEMDAMDFLPMFREKLKLLEMDDKLVVTTGQTWEPWLLFMLRAVEATAEWTTGKIVAIKALSDDAADHVRLALPKIYSRELIDVIFEQPYCRIANLVDKGIAQRQAAARYLKSLVRDRRAAGDAARQGEALPASPAAAVAEG